MTTDTRVLLASSALPRAWSPESGKPWPAVRPCDFVAGQLIFREDGPADGFYLIREGRVALETTGPRATLILTIGRRGPRLVMAVPAVPWAFDARA